MHHFIQVKQICKSNIFILLYFNWHVTIKSTPTSKMDFSHWQRRACVVIVIFKYSQEFETSSSYILNKRELRILLRQSFFLEYIHSFVRFSIFHIFFLAIKHTKLNKLVIRVLLMAWVYLSINNIKVNKNVPKIQWISE